MREIFPACGVASGEASALHAPRSGRVRAAACDASLPVPTLDLIDTAARLQLLVPCLIEQVPLKMISAVDIRKIYSNLRIGESLNKE